MLYVSAGEAECTATSNISLSDIFPHNRVDFWICICKHNKILLKTDWIVLQSEPYGHKQKDQAIIFKNIIVSQ